MAEGRGRKAKKAGDFKLRLGAKELVFGGLGVAGLVMMSFALGTLAGRGDIYRVLNNWGLIGPDSNRTAQVWYQAPPPSPAQVVPLAGAPSQEPGLPPAAKPGPPVTSAADRTPGPDPVKGSIIPAPNPVQARKKTLKPDSHAKEDKLEKIRQEVASKLKFQNSLDLSATRAPHAAEKSKKDKEPAAAAKPQAAPMVIAKYRDANQARAKLAHMQKQGDKVVLREGKDSEGEYFAICRQTAPAPAEPQQLAQSQVKKVVKIENKLKANNPATKR
jgi:hypothetical protein